MICKMKILLIVSVFFLIGCNSKKTPSEYIRWVNNTENGLVKVKETNKTKLTCSYTPVEYVVLKQFKKGRIDTAIYNEEINAINNMHHFILKFENHDGTNLIKDVYSTKESFQQKSMYLSYDIKSDLKLVLGVDTSICALNHHERTYGNTPYEQILLSFPKLKPEVNELTLVFDDRVFGFNRVKFFFSIDDLKDVPNVLIP